MWILKWLILIIIYKQSPNDFLNTHIEERDFISSCKKRAI